MTTYWLMGEKPINNNVQQSNPTTTIGQVSPPQDQLAVTTQVPTTQPKQQEQRGSVVIQHKHQGHSDLEVSGGWPDAQSIQSRNQEPRPGHPGQQRPQEPQQLQLQQQQQQGLTTQPRSQTANRRSGSESPVPSQIQHSKTAANPACGLTVTGNGAPKSVASSRGVVVATPIGNSSPSRNSANNPMHQVYPATESMPNHTESGPNAPLLLPAGAVPRV